MAVAKNIKSAAEAVQPKEMTSKKLPIFGAVLVLFATLGWFTFTRLSFSPVPWPDGSAFYLPSLDLLTWPPQWKMHSQAAFVATYDVANFNMMPFIPLVLGVLTRLGLGSLLGLPLAIKFISLAVMVIWAGLLGFWLFGMTRSKWFAWSVAGAALWDPIIRWGTSVVRSETWIGLFWLFILHELCLFHGLGKSTLTQKRNPSWWISIFLALAAYSHFEAIILVPATAIGLFQIREGIHVWIKNLFKVGMRTFLLLLPWVIYVLIHFPVFLDQMDVQFHRLGHDNSWISNSYLLFHSLFLQLGSPVGLPKFFNIAKGIFWFLILALTVLALNPVPWTRIRKNQPGVSKGLEVFVAAGIAFWSSFYLWCTKPEVWFITLCHLTLWPWLGVALTLKLQQKKQKIQHALVFLSMAYAGLSLAGNFGQMTRIQSDYSWSVYHDWIQCIERTVSSEVKTSVPKVWQPHIPDVLVELSSSKPQWDLVRALDFENLRDEAWRFALTADAILMTRYFDIPSHLERVHYEGPERSEDIEKISHEVDQPFGPMILERLSVEQPNQWVRRVCHFGPFFADIALRTGVPKFP